MKKSVIAIFLLCTILLTLARPALATNALPSESSYIDGADTINPDDQLLSAADIAAMTRIPIFFTYISDASSANLSSIQESADADLQEIFAPKADGVAYARSTKPVVINKPAYEIKEVAASEKADIINSVLYRNTFKQAKEMIDQGVSVNYVNIFVQATSAQHAGGSALSGE